MMDEGVEEGPTPGQGRLLAHDTVRFLLSMEKIPKRIRERFWFWSDPKTLALSNMTRADVNQLLEAFNFDALIVMGEVINDLPVSSSPNFLTKNKKASEIIQWLNDLKQAVKCNLLRSTGGPERERRLFHTTYAETRGRYEEHAPSHKGGLFHRGE